MSTNNEATEMMGTSWPSETDLQNWERQWQKDGNAQKQEIGEEATSSATIDKQNEEKKPIETIEIEDSGEEDITDTEIGIGKELPINKLIHSQMLLEKVICRWEDVLQFVNISNYEEYFVKFVIQCMVAFRVQQEGEDNLPTDLYIDQISELNKDKVTFKHCGSFELKSIQPNYDSIRVEHFDKWLQMLISAREGLPETKRQFRKKKRLKKELDKAISLSIFRRHLFSNPFKLFDGIIDQQQPPAPILPLFIDISPIILENEHTKKLLKLSPTDFVNIFPGLCIQVDVTKIKHSMKLPPLMTLLKYMLIPISVVTLEAPNYLRPFRSKVMLHSFNGIGHVLSSFKLPHQMLFPSEQLIQISLSIWAMNNIPIPTSIEQIQLKAAQFRDALMRSENINLVPLGKKSQILPNVQLPLKQLIQQEQEARRNQRKRSGAHLTMNNNEKDTPAKNSLQNLIRLI